MDWIFDKLKEQASCMVLQEGFTARQAALKLGRSPDEVVRWVRSFCEETPDTRIADTTKYRAVYTATQPHRTPESAADEMGLPRQWVRNWVSEQSQAAREQAAGEYAEQRAEGRAGSATPVTFDSDTILGIVAVVAFALGLGILIWAIVGLFTHGGWHAAGRLLLLILMVLGVGGIALAFSTSEKAKNRLGGGVLGLACLYFALMLTGPLLGADDGASSPRTDDEQVDVFDDEAQQVCVAAMTMQLKVAEGGAAGLRDVYAEALTDISQGARRTDHSQVGQQGDDLYEAAFDGRSAAAAREHQRLVRTCEREMQE